MWHYLTLTEHSFTFSAPESPDVLSSISSSPLLLYLPLPREKQQDISVRIQKQQQIPLHLISFEVIWKYVVWDGIEVCQWHQGLSGLQPLSARWCINLTLSKCHHTWTDGQKRTCYTRCTCPAELEKHKLSQKCNQIYTHYLFKRCTSILFVCIIHAYVWICVHAWGSPWGPEMSIEFLVLEFKWL